MGGTKPSKLDRFLVSPDLLNDWPAVSVTALERIFADHCPILCKSNVPDYGPTPFLFFYHWLLDASFNAMVKSVWEGSILPGHPMVVLKNKLKLLKSEIKSWRASMSQNDVSVARKTMEQWEVKAESEELRDIDSDSFRQARADYFEAEKLHSLSLKQKSRVKWAVDGDENSRYFHVVLRGRLKKNAIHGLSVNGNWVCQERSL